MKKEFSQEEMEQILKNDAVIPASVDEKIKETYDRLGLTTAAPEEHDKGSASQKTRPVRLKKKKVWFTIAAAAALTAGLGITAFAVNQLLKADLTERDGALSYDVSVDPEAKEAHVVTSSPTYIPEGYEYQEDGAYKSQWHNSENDGSMSITTHNAADLYLMSQTNGGTASQIDKDDYIKTIEIGGMNVDLFSSDSIYTDDDTLRQDVILTNEEYGYMIQISLDGPDLADDEALKVAEGLDIQVSDETVPYADDEEIAKIKEAQTADFDSDYDASLFYNAGDVITDPQDKDHKTEFKVTDVRLADSLSPDQFPKENYVPDYDGTVAPLLNEDGTLKPHERYSPNSGSLSKENLETTDSKFIVATVEITNTGDSSTEEYITPMLEYLSKDENGSYTRFHVQSASAAYQDLSVEGEPLYQSVQQSTGNQKQKQHVRFAEIGAGETLKCTFAWVVDEDCTDNAYLAFFDMYGGMTNSYPRVKVTE